MLRKQRPRSSALAARRVRSRPLRIEIAGAHHRGPMSLLLSLLVAELVLLVLVIADRYLDLSPWNDRGATPRRSLPVLLFPIAIALVCTGAQLVTDAASIGAFAAVLDIASVAALSLAVTLAARAAWLPWWKGLQAPQSSAHAFLEPRRPGAAVPTTFECLVHAHAAACTLMAIVVLLANAVG